jgi:pectin methylesterase-like acyl-CoA thioesterase
VSTPHGNGGCYSTIGAAVSNAQPNDTIQAAHGTYKEEVLIGKPLSLMGQHAENTIIDATGRSDGIYIDGIDNAGLANVVVKEFRGSIIDLAFVGRLKGKVR